MPHKVSRRINAPHVASRNTVIILTGKYQESAISPKCMISNQIISLISLQ